MGTTHSHTNFLPLRRLSSSVFEESDRKSSHLGQLESGAVEGMFQQLLDGGQHQVVVLLQEDLIAVTLLHFTTSRAEREKCRVCVKTDVTP